MIDTNFIALLHGEVTNSDNLIVIQSDNFNDPIITIDLEKLGTIIDGKTQGIIMNCGGDEIEYNYENFNAKFASGCNDDTSYLVFTLMDDATGIQTLGGYDNNGASISDLEIQKGNFYVKNKCNSENKLSTLISTVLIG